MMLNTKFGVALLAIFACSSVSAKDNGNNNKKKRMLRNVNGNLRRGINHRHLAVIKADDITEDVAFWTRTLQDGSMITNGGSESPMEPLEGRYLHADNMDRYPGYTGSIDISGDITVTFSQNDQMQFSYDLQGLEPGCADCGVHIHSGTTCDNADEVGGHYFSIEVDPWTTDGGATYNADENGTAKGSFSLSSGKDTVRANKRHAVVVHGQDGTRLSCGILEVKRWR